MRILASALLAAALAAPAQAALLAAAGKVDVTPDLETETVWLAGYGATGRKARGVHDRLHARALVVSDGKRTAAVVAVDVIGLYREDVERMRRELGWNGDKEYLFVSSTHQHSGPDTLGLWGRFPGVSGVDKKYHARLIRSVADLVRDLARRLEEAQIAAVRKDIDPRGLVRDLRDPVVLDPELDVVQVRAKKTGKTLGTLVRWSCHPETSRGDNMLVTADFPGQLCARVEEKTGGACVFQSGAIGGLLIPDSDHTPEKQFEEGERVGHALADAALAAVAGAPAAGGGVEWRTKLVRLPVENSIYLAFLPNLTFGHKVYGADGAELPRWKPYYLALRHLLLFPLPDRLRPWVETEVSVLRLGPAEFLGVPGELFPELAVGGYDGSRRYGYALTKPTNPAPPDLAAAPKGPYLRDKRRGKVSLIVGLANDELGYVIPGYDFKTTRSRTMTPHPPGGHYEETNSIGPSSTKLILDAFDELLAR
jgi:hypothetical protein